jgi:hypothetical protein
VNKQASTTERKKVWIWEQPSGRKERRNEPTIIIHGIYSIGNIKNYKDLSEKENNRKLGEILHRPIRDTVPASVVASSEVTLSAWALTPYFSREPHHKERTPSLLLQ